MQIGELIRRGGVMYGDAPAFVEGPRVMSFKGFDQATDRLGNALLAAGLVLGERVGVLLPNGIDCLVAYYALAKAGLVRVPLNLRETAADHVYKIADSGTRALIHGVEGSAEAQMVIGPERLAAMMAQGDATPCRVDRALDEPLRLGYTGGTTGKPKAVTLTTRGELAELSAFLVDLVPDMTEGDTFLHAAPIAHASGAFVLPAIVRGVRSVIMAKFDPASFIALAGDERATHTFLVPTMLAMIMEEPSLASAKLSLKSISYGASPIAPALLERAMARFGRVFAQTYGQAESPMVITCLKPEDHDRIGSCGRPFFLAEVAIFDDDDKPLLPGEKGEIVVRGPQLMARYWNRPEATDAAFRKGWLHTGDVGTMDKDGFFYILDRKNDMLISGGYNVYPREVEDVLLGCEGVVEAAVIGLPDEKWGDRVFAVVAGRADLDQEATLAICRDKLANYKCPKGLEIWPTLPKSAAGKILRREVRDQIIAREKPKRAAG